MKHDTIFPHQLAWIFSSLSPVSRLAKNINYNKLYDTCLGSFKKIPHCTNACTCQIVSTSLWKMSKKLSKSHVLFEEKHYCFISVSLSATVHKHLSEALSIYNAIIRPLQTCTKLKAKVILRSHEISIRQYSQNISQFASITS